MEENNIDCNLTHPNLRKIEELSDVKLPLLPNTDMNRLQRDLKMQEGKIQNLEKKYGLDD